MNRALTRTGATARRVLQQLRHDHRSVALVLVVPSVLLLVFKYVFDGQPDVFDRIGPIMLGMFGFIIMFLITSVTMVRERISGTLERILTTPIRRGEFIGGYALAFAGAALAQAIVTVAIAQFLLGLELRQPWWALGFAVVGAVVGTALGLLASAFARTEFQAVQFMPLVIIPQILVCGLLTPRESMPAALEWFAVAMPLTYVTDAFSELAASDTWSAELTMSGLVLIAFALGSLVLASLTLQRRTD